MRLVVTRPEPDASRTAASLRALGHEVIVSPALDIVFDRQQAIADAPYQAILVTSSNGARALADNPGSAKLTGLPLLAVGDRSAVEARRAGFADAHSAGGTAADLLRMARSSLRPEGGPLLWVCGEPQSVDLAAELRGSGYEASAAVLYRSVARSLQSDAALQALRNAAVDGILFYSPRSAAAFAASIQGAMLAPLSATLTAFCLSAACAAPLAAVTTGPVVVAERPDQISLFAAVETVAAARSG